MNRKVFAQRLNSLRTENNITMSILAEAINIKNKGTISQFENMTTAPSLDTIIDLADFFDVSIDYLVGRSNDPLRR